VLLQGVSVKRCKWVHRFELDCIITSITTRIRSAAINTSVSNTTAKHTTLKLHVYFLFLWVPVGNIKTLFTLVQNESAHTAEHRYVFALHDVRCDTIAFTQGNRLQPDCPVLLTLGARHYHHQRSYKQDFSMQYLGSPGHPMRIMRMVRSHSVFFLAMVVLVLLQGGPDVATPCLSTHHQVVKNMCAPVEHTRQPHYCGQYEQHVRLCSVTVRLIPWTTLLVSNAVCMNRRSTLRTTAVARLECANSTP